jgi:hypothetical protein
VSESNFGNGNEPALCEFFASLENAGLLNAQNGCPFGCRKGAGHSRGCGHVRFQNEVWGCTAIELERQISEADEKNDTRAKNKLMQSRNKPMLFLKEFAMRHEHALALSRSTSGVAAEGGE